jgi:hypothetical protein
MTTPSIAVLLISASSTAVTGLLWYGRLTTSRAGPASLRSNIALSALLSLSVSSVTFLIFVLLWLDSRAVFTGRRPIGLWTIAAGLTTTTLALLGGFCGHDLRTVLHHATPT